MSVTILLMRHGETDWNRMRIFRGIHDIPLNENGVRQARQIAEAIAARRIDAAYSSPLCRALETAKIALQACAVGVTIHEGLKDFNYGRWTGMEEEAVAKEWPDEYARWVKEPHIARPPGGDALQDVFDRAFAAVESIVEGHDGQTIALFGHRVVNKLLVLGMLSLGAERFNLVRQDNCCIDEFVRTEEGYVVIRLNDTCHIRQAGTALLNADF